MITINDWLKLSKEEQKYCLKRPIQRTIDISSPSHTIPKSRNPSGGINSQKTPEQNIKTSVKKIIRAVRDYGDRALFELTQQFDGVSLQSLKIAPEKIQNAKINQESLKALQQAIQSITTYHRASLPEDTRISTAVGITILNTYRPIQKVGLYVPAGNKTPLVSSLLMQAIPARVAGCPIKVLCTPPNATGDINAQLLIAARLCGIETIYTLGGAQAIAAMAYGTESVIKVDKLFGPGNSYVTQAKTLVANDPEGAAIDMPAGPSEVMISADEKANPTFVAADLLAQAEHGADSQVFLICDDLNFAQKVTQELEQQLANLARKKIITQSLKNSHILVCSNREEQLNIINSYAPEHLIINRGDAESWVSRINAVGTIFLGSWAAETMGDYVSGSNHVLPTHGFARNHNGLSTQEFLTRFTVQSINELGIKNLGPAAITLAQLEGLDAHANAVQIRLNALET
jgi:histidinol dehydrogenase